MVRKNQSADADDRNARPLQGMFSKVPDRYDLINRLFTFGLDARWRRICVQECMKNVPLRMLDLCTGTGDLAIAMARAAHAGQHVAAVDFTLPMLSIAREKADRAGTAVAFVAGDARELPFADGCFPVIGISFGFRNLTYKNPGRDNYLKEILRILEPGGRLVIMESSQPQWCMLRLVVHLYLNLFVSFLGGLISGQRGAYRYLARSAINFYDPDELSELLCEAGFSRVEYRRLYAGVSAMHSAYR